MKPLRETAPISNVLPDYALYVAGLRPVYEASRGQNLVAWAKARLGRQTRCFTGNRRYHLWEHGCWTLWVSNNWGFDVSVVQGLTHTEASDAFEEAVGMLLRPPV